MLAEHTSALTHELKCGFALQMPGLEAVTNQLAASVMMLLRRTTSQLCASLPISFGVARRLRWEENEGPLAPRVLVYLANALPSLRIDTMR